MRLALVGTGAIGGYLLDAIADGLAGPVSVVAIADVPDRADHLAMLARRFACTWHTDPAGVLEAGPEIVVEAAGPAVVRACGRQWLTGGASVLVMSAGALADPDLLRDLTDAANRSGCRVMVPTGAIAGLDAIRAARIGGLDEVQLRTTKPPRALAGAPGLRGLGVDLDHLDGPVVVFDGTAADAVIAFPANLNVVAALSLAGIGPDRTRVVLVADPAGTSNIHEITARGAFGELSIRLDNRPTPGNPKTSHLASLSAIALLRGLSEAVRVGS